MGELADTVSIGQVGLAILLLEEVGVVVEECKQRLPHLCLVLVVDGGVGVSNQRWVAQQGHVQLENLVEVGDSVLCEKQKAKNNRDQGSCVGLAPNM